MSNVFIIHALFKRNALQALSTALPPVLTTPPFLLGAAARLNVNEITAREKQSHLSSLSAAGFDAPGWYSGLSITSPAHNVTFTLHFLRERQRDREETVLQARGRMQHGFQSRNGGWEVGAGGWGWETERAVTSGGVRLFAMETDCGGRREAGRKPRKNKSSSSEVKTEADLTRRLRHQRYS